MAVARTVPASPLSANLIERDAPLAALWNDLREAVSRRGRFVVIRGEAGIGKSALLRAFLAEAAADVTVLSGAADGVSTPQPFAPLEDMVGSLGPELRGLLDADASRSEVGRWLLKRLSDEPHVLAIEDLQWADQATLELLAFLARRMETLPLLVVVTYREDSAASPSVTRILGSLASLPVLRQIQLEPLSRTGVARLAVEDGARVDVDDLYRLSAGNPFYVNEVLASSTRNGPPDQIPVSVLDAVRARMGQLDARGRRALQAAAVIGVRAEPWLLAAIAGEDLTGIDDALRVGLLVKADGIAFRHELTRMAVLEDLPVIHGIALHRRALSALERAGTGDAARLAYHAEGAADGAAVVRHASAAGHRALAMGALHEAKAQYERALRDAASPAGDERAAILERLSGALFLTNQMAAAYASMTEALALRRAAGDSRALAAALTSFALTAWANLHSEGAWTAAERRSRSSSPSARPPSSRGPGRWSAGSRSAPATRRPRRARASGPSRSAGGWAIRSPRRRASRRWGPSGSRRVTKQEPVPSRNPWRSAAQAGSRRSWIGPSTTSA